MNNRALIPVKNILIIFLLLCAMTACTAGRGPDICSPAPKDPVSTVQLVSHGWHTGLIFRVQSLPATPEIKGLDIQSFSYIEVGYGDADYYQGEGIRFLNLLTAGLLPTRAVLHIVKFNTPPEEYFSASEMTDVVVRQESLDRAWEYVAETFYRDSEGFVEELRPGLYGNSAFYSAVGQFTAFRNCNVWVGEVLKAAGCPVDPGTSLTTGAVMAQAKRISDSE